MKVNISSHDSSVVPVVERKWNFGSCHSSEGYTRYASQYTERCCLAEGQEYVLACQTSLPGGWKDGFVEVQGHKYCDDFITSKAMYKIEILGKYVNRKDLF